jgi:hypothetical protein
VGWGYLLIAASVLYYGTLEIRWFASKLQIGNLRAAGLTVLGMIEGSAVVLAVALLFAS